MSELNLPSEVRPLWVEGVFTAEFEKDTLPLLFADEHIFEQYYAALVDKNPHVSAAILQLQQRNALARRQRAEGVWQDCVESLAQCVELRRCIFNEADFQYTAAQKHYVLALLNFATFFLRESMRAKTSEAMLMRSFELFKMAETAVGLIAHREDRMLLKVAVENNFATYYAKRKKFSAAAQRMHLALRAWAPLKNSAHSFYFDVQRGSGEIFSNRFDEGLRILKKAAGCTPPDAQKRRDPPLAQSTGENEKNSHNNSSSDSSDDDEANAAENPPGGSLTYSLLVLNCALPAEIGAAIVLNHNIAVGLIGLRRYKEAGPWCTKAMELCVAHSNVLTAAHLIVIAVRSMQQFCEKMSFSTKFQQFKMKQDDHSSSQHRKMQAAVAEARVASAGSSRSRDVARLASADPKTAEVARTYLPHSGVRYQKPTQYEALRTYVKHMSYRQLVEEFGMDHKRNKAPRPPKSRESATANPHEAPLENSKKSESESSPQRARSSSRSSSSRRSSSASSNSPDRQPKETPREEARSPGADDGVQVKVQQKDEPAASPRTPSESSTPRPQKGEEAPAPATNQSPRTPSEPPTPSPRKVGSDQDHVVVQASDEVAGGGEPAPQPEEHAPQEGAVESTTDTSQALPDNREPEQQQAAEKESDDALPVEVPAQQPPVEAQDADAPSSDSAAPVDPATGDTGDKSEGGVKNVELPTAVPSSPEKNNKSYEEDFDATQSTTSELSPLKPHDASPPKDPNNTTYGDDGFEEDD